MADARALGLLWAERQAAKGPKAGAQRVILGVFFFDGSFHLKFRAYRV